MPFIFLVHELTLTFCEMSVFETFGNKFTFEKYVWILLISSFVDVICGQTDE